MASANQTIRGEPLHFEVDGTERTNTINAGGGYISNVGLLAGGGVTFYVHFADAAVTITDPGANSIPVPVGATIPVPRTCPKYRIKSSAGTTYAVHYPNV